MSKIKEISEKQKLFAQEYLANPNPVKAAKIAGYLNPKQSTERLLKNPLVKQYMEKIQKIVEDGVTPVFASEDEEFNYIMSNLLPKQQNFVREYLVDPNGSQAAIKAGYAVSGAKEQGSVLLTYPNIARAIEIKRKQKAEKLDITALDVLKDLLFVKDRCIQKIKPKMHFNFESRKTEQVEDDDGNKVFEFDSKGANRSLELIGKHLGMFVDRKKIEFEDGVQAVLAVLPPDIKKQVIAILTEKK